MVRGHTQGLTIFDIVDLDFFVSHFLNTHNRAAQTHPNVLLGLIQRIVVKLRDCDIRDAVHSRCDLRD